MVTEPQGGLIKDPPATKGSREREARREAKERRKKIRERRKKRKGGKRPGGHSGPQGDERNE